MRKFIFIFAVVVAAARLLWLWDDGLGLGWPTIALHNWQQYGLAALHGSLVSNPGGFEAMSHPDIYFGMSPWYLYPVYFTTQVFRWTGLGALSFFILLAVLVFWSIWFLLGKNNQALLVGALVILSPGYGRWQVNLDPNSISVLAGFPYAAAAMYFWKKEQFGIWRYVILFLLTAIFVPLNWTTVWFLAPFGVFLLCYSEVPRKSAVIFLTLVAVSTVLSVGVSIFAKRSGLHQTNSNGHGLIWFLGAYTWGNYAYYDGLSSIRVFFRVFFVNVAGLLPLLISWAWNTLQCILHSPRRGWTSLLPLATVIAEIIAMRNYFGHHPWMAAPVVIVGLVFSLALQVTGAAKDTARTGGLKWLAVAIAGAFCYGLIVLGVFRANNHENLSLIHLLREKVARSEGIVIVKALDPATAEIAKNIDSESDRHCIMVDALDNIPHDGTWMILSSCMVSNLQLIADEDANSEPAQAGYASSAAHWFNRTIARRKPGDKIDFATHYYLYRPFP